MQPPRNAQKLSLKLLVCGLSEILPAQKYMTESEQIELFRQHWQRLAPNAKELDTARHLIRAVVIAEELLVRLENAQAAETRLRIERAWKN